MSPPDPFDPPGDIEQHVLPILVAEIDSTFHTVSMAGTGFVIAPRVLITCWHCVDNPLPEGCTYVVAYPLPGGTSEARPLTNIQQDPSGADLASATVDISDCFFRLSPTAVGQSQEVASYGYPLPQTRQAADGQITIRVVPRYLQGYVTLDAVFDQPTYGPTLSYELDMPAPEGLSGGPVTRRPTREVIGVVYGFHAVATVEEFASIDSVTGQRRPEIERITGFALAHHTQTLKALSGIATAGQPLAEYLHSLGLFG